MLFEPFALPRLAAAVFAVAVPAAATAQDTGFTARKLNCSRRSPAPARRAWRSPWCAATGVVYLRGFGSASIETGAPVAPDTLFQIGSATKMLTAAAVMSAHAAKAIDVDAPVSRYVSGLTACVGAPTVRQLLSHTGGLMDEPDEFGPQGEEGLAPIRARGPPSTACFRQAAPSPTRTQASRSPAWRCRKRRRSRSRT